MKINRSIFVIITLSLLVSACSGIAAGAVATPSPIPTVIADTAIVSDGRLEPVRYAEIALNAGGLVSEVLVKEGDQVKAGQVIAIIEGANAQTLEDAKVEAMKELNAAYDNLRQSQIAMDDFDVPSDFAGMTPTQAVQKMLGAVNKARDEFEPYKSVSLSNQSARDYRRRLDDAWSKYRKAVQWMQLTTNLEAAQAGLNEAQADYDSLSDANFAEATAGRRAALANAELRVPFSGTVMSMKLKAGESATAGQAAVTIADTSNWVVKTTDLTEIDVVKLSEGQPVTITLDALPEKALKGNVLLIGQSYSENQGDIVYEVTILLTETDPAMRWGMTAAAKFE